MKMQGKNGDIVLVQPIIAKAHVEMPTRSSRPAEFLTPGEESRLSRAWLEHSDTHARNRLVVAYLPFAYKHARRFARGGADIEDLKNEAVMGLMKAADRFDPDRGWAFSTYALWWIRACVLDFSMRNHAMVQMPQAIYRRLFFTMRKTTEAVSQEMRNAGLTPDASELRIAVADKLGVPLADIERFEGILLHKDVSLNRTVNHDEEGSDLLSLLVDENEMTEHNFIEAERHETQAHLIAQAMACLNVRERDIVISRWLGEEPVTLEALGKKHGVSRERIRQIEVVAFNKLREKIGVRRIKNLLSRG